MSKEDDGDFATENAMETSSRGMGELDLVNMLKGTTHAKAEDESEEVQDQQEEIEETQEEETETVTEALSTEEAEEIEEESETEEENVLSKEDRSIEKMRKRIDETTYKWKSAEEKAEALERENEELRRKVDSPQSPKQDAPKGFAEKVESAENMDQLQKLYDEAKLVKSNAKKLLRKMDDAGESEIEHNGQTLSRNEIYNALDDAESAMDGDIQNKANLFQQKREYDKVAIDTFDFFQDTKSEYHKKAQEFLSDSSLDKFLRGRADEYFILGLLVEGQRSLDLKQKAAEAKEQGKTDVQAKLESTPKIAPEVPGLSGKVAPKRLTKEESKIKKKRSVLNQNKLNVNDLASLLSKK